MARALTALATQEIADAHRHPRGLRRDARPGQGGQLRLPGHQRHVLADAERRAAGLRRGRSPTASSRSPPAARSTCPARPSRTWSTGSVAFAAYAARGRQELPGQHRAAHRPLPEGQARRLRPAAARRLARAGRRAASTRCSSRTCGTARPCRWTRTSQIAQELLGQGRRGQDHPRDRGRRRRRRGGRRRGRDRREALHHRRGRAGHRRGARPRRERPLPDRADLRQRARRLQAGQRQAAPGDPQADPGGGRREVRPRGGASRSTWSSTAAPARCRGDPRGRRLRRGQDERRHRHPVRLHPAGRRPHVRATTTAC